MTKAEQDHLDRVAALGCIICGRHGMGGMFQVEAEIHHIRRDPKDGMHFSASQRATHFQVIPLCPIHHRLGRMGEAYHAGPRAWEAQHGTEIELLAKVQAMLEEAK